MPSSKRVHFVGIGGAGMSAIARVLLSQGTRVTGSDIQESPATQTLRRMGADVAIGHHAKHVMGADEVIVSTAITAENPEVEEARRIGIPVHHRSEALAGLLNQKRGVAVAGAHGKTTVTSMISWTLEHLGERPTFLIGGEIPGLGAAKVGDGPILVAEADESDRSFLRYRPEIAVVTSIEPDHLEYYDDSFDVLVEGYMQFLQNVKPDGVRIVCVDDPQVRTIMTRIETLPGRWVTYGLQQDAAYRPESIRMEGFESTFDLFIDGESRGAVSLRVPGRHNIQNALACLAVCHKLQLPLAGVKRALADFGGARRRFEVVGEAEGALIIDDYAHHPSEIKATLRACKSGWRRRVVAVFQPHRFSRTAQLMDEFAHSFGDADVVVLTDIYSPPPDRPIPGVSGKRLADLTKSFFGNEVYYVERLEDVADRVRQLLQPGDILLTMGAGDVWKVARNLAAL